MTTPLWVRYRITAYRLLWSDRPKCNAPGPDHGGVRNLCLLYKGHRFRHCDLWGDKWR